MTAFVLGGGPAGLAVVNGLGDKEPFVLFERAPHLGGLATTLTWDDYGAHDLGPHKLFTKDTALMQRVESLLPATEWLTRPKQSSIFMQGHFLPYPPSPFSLLGVYGPFAFASMLRDYGLAQVRSRLSSKSPPNTFADDLEARVGKTLYRELFEPIATKLWGDPHGLDVKLSRGRVQTPKVSEVVLRTLGVQKTSEFEALSFRYPRGGLRRLWQAIADGARKHGELLVRHEIERLRVEGNTVREIVCRDRANDSVRSFDVAPGDFVFSTLPLAVIAGLLGDAVRQETRERIRDTIVLNDLYLCFLKIDRPSLLDESWVFVPDPRIAFHRVSEQESFDPEMTPNGSIVCCEIMGNDSRPTRGWTDAELLAACERGLAEMNYSGYRVEASRVIRLPASYPVYRTGYEPALEAVMRDLDGLTNLRSIGRQGSFNYIGTLDAMDIGYGAARWLLAQRSSRGPAWSEERRRTDHYPVLD